MQALLMKDFYILFKHMKMMFLLVVIFAFFNRGFGYVFLPTWCSMLPYTSVAYDDQSKWDQLAAMMPYSVRELVLSKYLLGWICTVGMTGILTVLQLILSLTGISLESEVWLTLILGVSASVCILAASMPLIFRFGVERGRLLIFLLIFAVCGGAGALTFLLEDFIVAATTVAMLMPVLALALTVISVPLSIRFYRKKRQ